MEIVFKQEKANNSLAKVCYSCLKNETFKVQNMNHMRTAMKSCRTPGYFKMKENTTTIISRRMFSSTKIIVGENIYLLSSNRCLVI